MDNVVWWAKNLNRAVDMLRHRWLSEFDQTAHSGLNLLHLIRWRRWEVNAMYKYDGAHRLDWRKASGPALSSDKKLGSDWD